MIKRTHMFAGAAAVINFISINNILFFPVAVLGAIIPDWDYKIGLKHRGITHTVLALFVTTSILSIFNLQLGLLWGLGYSTHLLLDSLTVTGIPLLYIYIKRKITGIRYLRLEV